MVTGDSDVRRLGVSMTDKVRVAFLTKECAQTSAGGRKWGGWHPVVGSTQLLSALFRPASAPRLEAALAHVATASTTADPVKFISRADRLPHTRQRYATKDGATLPSEYASDFQRLTARAAADARGVHEAERLRGIRVVWGMNLDMQRVAQFALPPSALHRWPWAAAHCLGRCRRQSQWHRSSRYQRRLRLGSSAPKSAQCQEPRIQERRSR